MTNVITLVVALLMSPTIAAFVSYYVSRIKNNPLLEFSKIPLSIGFLLESVSIESYDAAGYSELYNAVYDYSFTSAANYTAEQYRRIITDLARLVQGVHIHDDSKLSDALHDLFDSSLSIHDSRHFPIAINCINSTLLHTMQILSKCGTCKYKGSN